MPEFILSSSILSADFTRLGDEIRTAEAAGVDWIHIDVMDGQFVPNISMGPFVVATCRRVTTLPLDVHLMIEHPERYIQAFAEAGASRMSVHIENNNNVYRTLEEIRALGCKPGIVINPGTTAASIASVIPLVDLVLVMTVNPGYSGQVFMPAMVKKVAEVRAMLDQQNSAAIIQVDGGITHDNLPAVFQAGARCVVAATSIFKHPQGIDKGIHLLRESLR